MVDKTKFEVENILFVVEEVLYSILYKCFDTDEFERLFDLWTDVEYLEDFFENNKEDLNNDFWKGISVEEAILKTYNDALDLEEKLFSLAEEGTVASRENLASFFKPISLSSEAVRSFTMSKAYGQDRPSWLRIYALKMDDNLFVVTGGAIKLTPTMNTKEHLELELSKLRISRKFIIDYPFNLEVKDIPFFELVY